MESSCVAGRNGPRVRYATISDYRSGALADAWGLRIKELDPLARAVYVVDKSGKVTYHEIVPEIASEPNYAAAIAARAAA